jgi:serine/threonine-protein kinase
MIICPDCGGKLPREGAACPKCGERSRYRAGDLKGRTIADKYLIEDHLGTGGMCDVFRARHATMGKQFAVKVLKPELAADPRIAERFEQEARASSLIHHPHAISVVDYGHSGPDFRFIVMELVEGKTLGDLLRRNGPLPIKRAANILRQVSNALDAAHAVGVVHRDVKPDNIIIAEYDGADWVKVVDFGVAKIQEDVNRRARLTGDNIIVGTPRYMSPEQCEERPVDARSDIYSLGVVLYEMLSGEAPFEGNSSMRLLMAHVSEPPPPLREKRPDLSPEIEQVVMRSLEKDPARRYPTAGEFAASFEDSAEKAGAGAAISDRGGAYSRISVPLGEQDMAGQLIDDEQTLVRPRPKTPVAVDSPASPVYSDADSRTVSLDETAGLPHATPVETSDVRTRPASVVYRSNAGEYRSGSGWAWALGIAALILVAAATVYIMFGDRLLGRSPAGGPVLEAQQVVTDALARVDSLPKEHPLRAYLPQLAQWQGELRAYSEVGEYGPEVINRAENYRRKAEDIAAQARAAAHAGQMAPADNATKGGAQQQEEAAGQVSPDERANPAKGEGFPEETPRDDRNSNTGKPRRAEPPVLEPVKPLPPEKPPANSNRRRPDPPAIENLKPQ